MACRLACFAASRVGSGASSNTVISTSWGSAGATAVSSVSSHSSVWPCIVGCWTWKYLLTNSQSLKGWNGFLALHIHQELNTHARAVKPCAQGQPQGSGFSFTGHCKVLPFDSIQAGRSPVNEAGNAIFLTLGDERSVSNQRLKPASRALGSLHVKPAGVEDFLQVHLQRHRV